MLFSFLLAPGQASLVVYAFAAIVGLGTGGVIVMMYAIFPDIPDVDELKSGERREGIYSALVTLIRKMSSALAIFAVSNAIGWAGYVQPREDIVDGATKLVEQPQTGQFVLVLRLIFAVLPVVLLALSIFFARRYPLSPQVHERLNLVLAARRAGDLEVKEEQAEVKELERLLVG